MSETPTVSSTASTPPSSAAEQARIRKERREAKIKAGGSARLNRITGLGGGIQRDPPPQTPTPLAPSATDPTADPEEVDISQHFYQPKTAPRTRDSTSSIDQTSDQITDDQLRAMMLGNAFAPQGQQSAGPDPFSGFPGLGANGIGGGAGADDPMMKMLQQMMGGIPSEGPNGMPSFPGMPPMGMPGQTQESVDPYAYLWRIVHAIFALSLGCYIALTTTFTGSKLDREISALSSSSLNEGSIRFFYIFATFEVLLQTSRFFFEKGQVQQAGILGMVLGFLPEPWKGYLELALRYSRIWTTISADAMRRETPDAVLTAFAMTCVRKHFSLLILHGQRIPMSMPPTLNEYLRKTLAYIDSHEDQSVPKLVVRTMIAASSVLIAKSQRIPDTTTVMAALSAMQIDLKTTANTVQTTAATQDKVAKLSQETYQKVNEAAVLRSRTTELLQETNDIAKVIQSMPSPKPLYASVMSSNATPLSKPIASSTQTSSFIQV